MITLFDATKIAASAHAEQTDKAGQPYIRHPLRVVASMSTEEERVAAVLHDVVEDTDWTLAGLAEAGLDGRALEAVGLLTKRPGVAYADYVAGIAEHDVARRVKIGDLRDNMDPARLAALPPEVRARLVEKYRGTLDRLLAVEAEVSGRFQQPTRGAD